MDKIKGLYYIKDLRNDNIIYIGKTTDFKRRKYCHFCTHSNYITPIDNYIINEGKENFIMELFTDINYTEMSDKELLEKEDELIILYDTINNGFNKRRSGLIRQDVNYLHNYYQQKKENNEKYIEYTREYSKEYYKNNKDKCLQYKREYNKHYRELNKEKIKQYMHNRYIQNKENK